jgi:hypothetical protein
MKNVTHIVFRAESADHNGRAGLAVDTNMRKKEGQVVSITRADSNRSRWRSDRAPFCNALEKGCARTTTTVPIWRNSSTKDNELRCVSCDFAHKEESVSFDGSATMLEACRYTDCLDHLVESPQGSTRSSVC